MRNGRSPAVAWLALAWAFGSPAAGACGQVPVKAPHYRHRALRAAAGLGVEPGYARAHGWTLQPEAPRLVQAGRDIYGRALRLAPRAAAAWLAMTGAAARDGIALQTVSGFRSFGYQRRLLRRKLERGLPLASVLEVNALPGFSEHHSGCALDLTAPGAPAADASFADTAAFGWLTRHAGRFGFVLSYPAGNARGIAFEPWHWRYAGVHAPARHTAPEPSHDATLAGVSLRTTPFVQAYP